MEMKIYKDATSFGVCVEGVDPYSEEATAILDLIEPEFKTCSMPDCNDKCVRVGVFEHGRKNGVDSEFRGLCERHKNHGILNLSGGWDLDMYG